MRQAAGMDVRHDTRYGQKALAFAVTHAAAARECLDRESTAAGGPFTLVPLPDHEGQPVLGRRLDGARSRGATPCRSFGGRFRGRSNTPGSRALWSTQACIAAQRMADH